MRLASAALSAGVVALMEEVVFRGGVYGALRKTMPWITAVVVSSVFFALLHFFRRPVSPTEIEWSSGLVVLGRMLGGFTDWEALIPGFFNITIVGMMLAWMYQRTGNLYFSIGLHTGWVFWLKLFGFVCTPEKSYNRAFWGTQTLTDGWFAVLALMAAVLVLYWRPRREGALQ
jgi:membrane protease YdiL (CAAX protease family)